MYDNRAVVRINSIRDYLLLQGLAGAVGAARPASRKLIEQTVRVAGPTFRGANQNCRVNGGPLLPLRRGRRHPRRAAQPLRNSFAAVAKAGSDPDQRLMELREDFLDQRWQRGVHRVPGARVDELVSVCGGCAHADAIGPGWVSDHPR